ncbi:TPA: hypothetical protein ACN35S_004470 [Vibrio parahaemolyticus]
MVPKYQIKSNLSEAQIESDVSTFFGWMSESAPFRLHDVNEQLTGSDKAFYNQGFAFLMQFKKSEGLYSASDVLVSTRKNRSKLEDIREFRQKHNLNDDPTLYFPLRKKAKNALDLQHNVLLEYANQPSSQAFYVAPLLLDKKDYYNTLFDSVNRFQKFPFHYKKYRLHRRDWVSTVGFVPFLKEHISIIPHERVTTHEHYYSFSGTGSDIGWHSPEIMSESPQRLGETLDNEIKTCVRENKFVSLEALPEVLEIDYQDSFSEANDPLEALRGWGNLMYRDYGIKVFVLLAHSEYLESYKREFA